MDAMDARLIARLKEKMEDILGLDSEDHRILEVAIGLVRPDGTVSPNEVRRAARIGSDSRITKLRSLGLWEWPIPDQSKSDLDKDSDATLKARMAAEREAWFARCGLIDGRDEDDETPPGIVARPGRAKGELQRRNFLMGAFDPRHPKGPRVFKAHGPQVTRSKASY